MSTIRFFGEFRDEVGTDWRINLHDTNYNGTSNEITLGAEGFTLRYTGDSENRFQPIIGSSVTFTVLNDGGQFETFLNTVFPAAEEGRMQVEIRKDPDNTDLLYWAGVVAAEQIEQEDAPAPNLVNLTASDDLANLKDTKFIQESGSSTIVYPARAAIMSIMTQMRTTVHWGAADAFFRYVNDVQFEDYTGADWLKDVFLSSPTITEDCEIYDGERGYNSFEILESIAASLNARIFQSNGYWWFIPVNCHLRAADGDDWTTDLKQLNLAGAQVTVTTAQSAELTAGYINEVDSDFVKMAGGTISNLPPYKRVRRVRRYKGNDWIFSDYTTGITTGDNVVFADTDRTYIENLQFNISGSCQILLPSQSFENNPFNNAVVQVQMTIKCGTLYYTNTGWGTSVGEYAQAIAQFQRGDGIDGAFTWGVTTDELPSQQDGLDVTIQVRIIQVPSTDVTSDYTATGVMILISQLLLSDDQGLLGDGLLYEAVTTLDNKLIFDQGEFFHGDPTTSQFSTPIYYVNESNYTIDGIDNEYVSSQTTSALPLHRLGVQEALSGGQFPIPIKRGQIYGRLFEMWQTIKEGTEYFAPFCFDAVLNSRQSNVQRWQLVFDTTNITTNEAILNNDEDTLQTSMLRNAVVQSTSELFEQVRQLRAGELSNFCDVRTIQNRSASNNYVLQNDTHLFNSWIGSNGSGNLYLPIVANSEGRVIQIHSDDTIAANKFVKLLPNVTDTSATIDGAASYSFDRAYDGITILCHNSNWYIIQKKEK